MTDFDITSIKEENGVTIISFNMPNLSVSGSTAEIAQHISELIKNSKPTKIIVDFTGVKFFSSQTLGILIDTHKKVSAYNGSVVISGINPQLYRVFKITNLNKIFKFYPDNSSAIEDMKN